jgi:hypothetical protein
MFAQHATPFGTKVEQVVVELHLKGLLHLSLKREIHAIRSIISANSHRRSAQMKQWLCQLGVVALFLIAVQPVRAASPTIVGEISGIELCPEIACGAAIFNGTFQGTVGNKPTPGFFWVAIQHEALPAAGKSSPIFGGKWSLSTFWGKFGGTVLGGSVFNNGNNTFNVSVTLELKSGGTGQLLGAVVLDHNDFPPTVEGKLSQP